MWELWVRCKRMGAHSEQAHGFPAVSAPLVRENGLVWPVLGNTKSVTPVESCHIASLWSRGLECHLPPSPGKPEEHGLVTWRGDLSSQPLQCEIRGSCQLRCTWAPSRTPLCPMLLQECHSPVAVGTRETCKVSCKAFACEKEGNNSKKRTEWLVPFHCRHLHSERGKGAFSSFFFPTGREAQGPLSTSCSQLNIWKVKKPNQVALGYRDSSGPVACRAWIHDDEPACRGERGGH